MALLSPGSWPEAISVLRAHGRDCVTRAGLRLAVNTRSPTSAMSLASTAQHTPRAGPAAAIAGIPLPVRRRARLPPPPSAGPLRRAPTGSHLCGGRHGACRRAPPDPPNRASAPVRVRHNRSALLDRHVDNAHRRHEVGRAALIGFEPRDRIPEGERPRNGARVANPRGPTSTIVPPGESTRTWPTASNRARMAGASCRSVTGGGVRRASSTNLQVRQRFRAQERGRRGVRLQAICRATRSDRTSQRSSVFALRESRPARDAPRGRPA